MKISTKLVDYDDIDNNDNSYYIDDEDEDKDEDESEDDTDYVTDKKLKSNNISHRSSTLIMKNKIDKKRIMDDAGPSSPFNSIKKNDKDLDENWTL